MKYLAHHVCLKYFRGAVKPVLQKSGAATFPKPVHEGIQHVLRVHSKFCDFPNHWEDKLTPSRDSEASHDVAVLQWCTKSAFWFHKVWVSSTLAIWEEDISFNAEFYTMRWFAIKPLQRRNSFKILLNLSSSSFSPDLMQFYLLLR